MKRIPQALQTVEGDFGRLSAASFMLSTENAIYRAEYVSFSGLSATEEYGVNIVRADGQQIMSFDLLRKYLKRGMRVNCTGYGGWNSVQEAIEAMTRHFVARFEAQAGAVAA